MSSAEEHRAVVRRFYAEIWNHRNVAAAEALLADDLAFRGSLGAEHDTRDGFLGYVAEVSGALQHYRCDIDTLVADDEGAAARMRFSGRHTGVFMGVAPTGRVVGWSGAAFFGFRDGRIARIWVLGDLAALYAQLGVSGGAGQGA